MAKSNLHFQLNFPKQSEEKIRSMFSFGTEEKIACAIWCGNIFNQSLRESGFVFTDKAMYWNINGKSDSVDPASNPYKTIYNGTGKEIVLDAGEKSCSFVFPETMKDIDFELVKKTITRYFKEYLAVKTFGEDIEKLDESNSVVFTALMAADFFEMIPAKFKKSPKKEKAKETSDAEHNAQPSDETGKKPKKEKHKKVAVKEEEKQPNVFVKSAHFIRHILDLVCDLVLILAIVLLIKPTLFNPPKVDNKEGAAIEKIDDYFATGVSELEDFEKKVLEVPIEEGEKVLIPEEIISIEDEPILKVEKTDKKDLKKAESAKAEKKDEVKEAKRKLKEAKLQKKQEKQQKRVEFWGKYWRSFVCFAVFLIIKILIIASSKKSRKAVCGIILAIMTVFTVCAFIPKVGIPFAIYSIILLLLMLAMQFSMGFAPKAVGRKIIWFVILGCVGYVLIHASIPDFADNMKLAFSQMSLAFNQLALPVKWW